MNAKTIDANRSATWHTSRTSANTNKKNCVERCVLFLTYKVMQYIITKSALNMPLCKRR